MNSALVSVITPIFNSRKFLKETFRSLKEQTIGFANIEWIAADDYSNDGSYEYLIQISKRHKNIKVLRTQQNSGGASTPRNLALNQVTAPFVMFLDSDDTFEPDAIRLLLDIMTQTNVGLANGAFCYSNRQKKVAEQRYTGRKEGYYQIFDDIDSWFPISHPIFTKMFRTKVIKKKSISFNPSLRIGEDSLFLFQYMQYIERAYHINKIICSYRYRSNSTSHSINREYFNDLFYAISEINNSLHDSHAYVFYDKFVEVTAYSNMVLLCNTPDITIDEGNEIIEQWFPILRYTYKHGYQAKDPISAILLEAVKKNNLASTKFYFREIKKLVNQNNDKLNEIYSSRTWKLLATIRRLLSL